MQHSFSVSSFIFYLNQSHSHYFVLFKNLSWGQWQPKSYQVDKKPCLAAWINLYLQIKCHICNAVYQLKQGKRIYYSALSSIYLVAHVQLWLIIIYVLQLYEAMRYNRTFYNIFFLLYCCCFVTKLNMILQTEKLPNWI